MGFWPPSTLAMISSAFRPCAPATATLLDRRETSHQSGVSILRSVISLLSGSLVAVVGSSVFAEVAVDMDVNVDHPWQHRQRTQFVRRIGRARIELQDLRSLHDHRGVPLHAAFPIEQCSHVNRNRPFLSLKRGRENHHTNDAANRKITKTSHKFSSAFGCSPHLWTLTTIDRSSARSELPRRRCRFARAVCRYSVSHGGRGSSA